MVHTEQNGICHLVMTQHRLEDLFGVQKCYMSGKLYSQNCNSFGTDNMMYCVKCKVAFCRLCVEDGTAENYGAIQIWHGDVVVDR